MGTRAPIPSNIFPSLTYDDAPAAIEWLCRAFGFRKRMVISGPNGTVRHSELSYGPGVIMVSTARPSEGRVSPRTAPVMNQALCMRVDDPDAHCARARAAGATITRDVQDEEYGARGYMATDVEGHSWYFGDYLPGQYWDGDD